MLFARGAGNVRAIVGPSQTVFTLATAQQRIGPLLDGAVIIFTASADSYYSILDTRQPVANFAALPSFALVPYGQILGVLNVDVLELYWSDGTQWQRVGQVPSPPGPIAYAATIAPVSAADVTYRCVLTGAVTIGAPSGPTDGDSVVLWLTASAGDRAATLGVGIVVPTSSAFSGPLTITSGTKAKLLLEYDASLNGGQWELTDWSNGY